MYKFPVFYRTGGKRYLVYRSPPLAGPLLPWWNHFTPRGLNAAIILAQKLVITVSE